MTEQEMKEVLQKIWSLVEAASIDLESLDAMRFDVQELVQEKLIELHEKEKIMSTLEMKAQAVYQLQKQIDLLIQEIFSKNEVFGKEVLERLASEDYK